MTKRQKLKSVQKDSEHETLFLPPQENSDFDFVPKENTESSEPAVKLLDPTTQKRERKHEKKARINPEPNSTSRSEQRKQEKAKRLERKQRNPNHEAIQKIIKAYDEVLNLEQKARTNKEIQKVINSITIEMKHFIFKHHLSRVVQMIIKFGDNDQREFICRSLAGQYFETLKNTYSVFIIKKLIYYMPSIISRIFLECEKKITILATQKTSCSVINDMYVDTKDNVLQTQIIECFYGNIETHHKALQPRLLRDYLALYPEQRETTINNLYKHIFKLVEKALINFEFAHRLIEEFFSEIPLNDPRVNPLIDSIVTQAANLIHTAPGSRVLCHIIAISNSKTRKTTIKGLKDYAIEVVKDRWGIRVLLSILMAVDDTAAINKYLLSTLVANAKEILMDKNAHLVFDYLCTTKDPNSIIPPDYNKHLLYINGPLNIHSKKGFMTRRIELMDFCKEKVIQTICENFSELSISPVSSYIIDHILSDDDGGIDPLLEILCSKAHEDSFVPGSWFKNRHASSLVKMVLNNSDKRVVMALFDSMKPNLEKMALDKDLNYLVLTMLNNNFTSVETLSLLNPYKNSLKLKLSNAGIIGAKIIEILDSQ